MKSPYVIPLAALAAFSLAGCGGKGPAENSAAQLDNAAAQSSPEAAGVLNRAAEDIRASNVTDPNAAQAAMQAAGNAEAHGSNRTGNPGAKPHAPGDPVPPPKIGAGQAMPGNSGTQDHGPR